MNPYIQSLGINRFWGEMGEDKTNMKCHYCNYELESKGDSALVCCNPTCPANVPLVKSWPNNPTPPTQTPRTDAEAVIRNANFVGIHPPYRAEISTAFARTLELPLNTFCEIFGYKINPNDTETMCRNKVAAALIKANQYYESQNKSK